MTSLEPRLAVLQREEIGNHNPIDNQDGEWQEVTIPFSTFEGKMSLQAGISLHP